MAAQPDRYDVFLSFHGSHVINPAATQPRKQTNKSMINFFRSCLPSNKERNSTSAQEITLRDVVKEKLAPEDGILQRSWLAAHNKGNLSIFFDDRALTQDPEGRLQKIFDGLLKTRGGGVVAILAVPGYFDRHWCLTELLSAVQLSSSTFTKDENERVRLCFIGVGMSVGSIFDAWFMKEVVKDIVEKEQVQFHSIEIPFNANRADTAGLARKIADKIVQRAGPSLIPGASRDKCLHLVLEDVVDRLVASSHKNAVCWNFSQGREERLPEALAKCNLSDLKTFLQGRPEDDHIRFCLLKLESFERKWCSGWCLDKDWSQARLTLAETHDRVQSMLESRRNEQAKNEARNSSAYRGQETGMSESATGKRSINEVSKRSSDIVIVGVDSDLYQPFAKIISRHSEVVVSTLDPFKAQKLFTLDDQSEIKKKILVVWVTRRFLAKADSRSFVENLKNWRLKIEHWTVFPVFWDVSPDEVRTFVAPLPTLCSFPGWKRVGGFVQAQEIKTCSNEFLKTIGVYSRDPSLSSLGNENYDLFISYAKEHRQYALELEERLSPDFSVFIDVKKLEEGRDDHGETIAEAIGRTKCLVSLLSAEYAAKAYPIRELCLAYERSFEVSYDFFLPVYFDISRQDCALLDTTAKIAVLRGIEPDLNQSLDERCSFMIEKVSEWMHSMRAEQKISGDTDAKPAKRAKSSVE